MNLKEQLANDFKDAMIKQDKLRKNTIQMIRGSILQVEKDTQCVLSDIQLYEILMKEKNTRLKALPEFEKGNRMDLVNQLLDEIKLIENYLPPQLNENELLLIIDEAIQKANAQDLKDMGKVMAIATQQTAGRADNKQLANLIKEKLKK